MDSLAVFSLSLWILKVHYTDLGWTENFGDPMIFQEIGIIGQAEKMAAFR